MYDPALHLFIDDYYIRNIFALKRIFGKAEKLPRPALRDIPGRRDGFAGFTVDRFALRRHISRKSAV